MPLFVTTFDAGGASGEKYPLYYYLIGDEIPEDQQGIYLFCREIKGNWEVVYIGHGNIKFETEKLIKEGKVLEKGSTHIYVHVDNDVESQIRKESDIIGGNLECYEPTGCNIKM